MHVPVPSFVAVSSVALAVAALAIARPDHPPLIAQANTRESSTREPTNVVSFVATTDPSQETHPPEGSVETAHAVMSPPAPTSPVFPAGPDPSSDGGSGDCEIWTEADEAAERATDNADSEALAAYLTAHGVAFTRMVDSDGWIEIEWNEDDEAANLAVDDFWWERDPYSADEIAGYNTETAEVSSLLTEAGIAHTIVTDPHGRQDVAYDENDDRANEIVDDYYAGDEGDEERAEEDD